MALGITDLINNIVGSVEGLVGDILGTGDKSIPNYHRDSTDFKGVQSQVRPENWNKLSFPYTFSVVNLGNTATPAGTITATDGSGGFQDFPLPLAPQSITQSESPAIDITPTQGGTTTNHSGNRYKTLTIKGTTGIAPFRGDGGVNAQNGEAIFQPKQLKYKSGYEVFLHLRNWLRTYYEYKRKLPQGARDLRLLFKNYKDGEFLIVELENFTMDRQAGKSFLYDYSIEFRVLSHFQFANPNASLLQQIENGIENVLNKITLARGVFLRSQGILRQIEATYNNTVLEPLRQATLAVKALQGVGIVAGDVSDQIVKNTVSQANTLAIALGIQSQQNQNKVDGLLDPRIAAIVLPKDLKNAVKVSGAGLITSFGEGLMALDPGIFPPKTLELSAVEQSNSLDLPRSFYETAIDNLNRVKRNAEDFFNLGSAEYNALFHRTATLNADFDTVVTDAQYDLMFAFNQALLGLYLLLTTQDLFKSSFDERIADMNARFDGNIQLIANQAVQQIKIPQGMTIERLAQKLLGDSLRWGEIAEVNNLKSPYISEDVNESRDGVLKPGDNILIPIPVTNGFSRVPTGKDNKLTVNMSELEKSLGVDLKIDADFDLILTSSGDLEITAGADNMGQAVIIKLSYEPGELIRYPELGAGILIGTKFPAIGDIKDGVTNTLLQDSRVEQIIDPAILRDGDALTLTFTLKIKNVDIPIPIRIKL